MKAALLLAQFLVLAAVVVPYWYWDGGLLEVETTHFIQQYLDGRGLLQKVFDPHANDLGTYQARELSYFLDYLDAKLFGLLIARGYAIFIPGSALIASLLTIGIFFRGVRRYSTLPSLTVTLVLLLYLSNYVHIVTMGMFYRSTKPLLAPVLMGTTFYLLSLVGVNAETAAPAREGKWAPLIVFALFCGMSLLDRQGFFYALVGAAVLVSNTALAGGRRDLSVAAAAAVGVMSLYNVVLAPLIVAFVNGYTPSFEYQRLPLTNLWTDPGHFARAGELLTEASALLMGGVPNWMCVGVLSLMLVWAFREAKESARSSWTKPKIILVSVLVALAQVLMFAAMIARHPPIYDQYDHRVWYYPLPFQALLVTVLIVLLSQIVAGWKTGRLAVVNLLLVAGLISNAAHWSDYSRLQRRSQWFSVVYTQTYLLKLSLKDGRPYPEHEGYLDFCRFCLAVSPPFRARAERAASRD